LIRIGGAATVVGVAAGVSGVAENVADPKVMLRASMIH
jgi:hypothetical protein